MIQADVLRDRIDTVIANMERQFVNVAPTFRPLIAESLGGSKTAYRELQSLGRQLLAPTIDVYGLGTASLAADWYDLNRELAKISGPWSGAVVQDPNLNTGPLIGGSMKDFVTVETVWSGIQAGMEMRVRQAAQGTIMDSTLRDPQATGWGRVASAGCCSYCAMLAGRGNVYRSQNTATFMPHSHCVPGWTPVTATSVEYATRRWYSGEMVTVNTERGQKLTITPNHSVLTNKGWVPAGFLREGDGVFGSLDRDRIIPRVPDEQHGETSIEDHWGALRMMGRLTRVPLTAEDFHGDGPQGEVDVVSIDRHLAPERYPSVSQPFSEQALALGWMELPGTFAGLCDEHSGLGGALRAANSGMGGGGQLGTLFRGKLGHALAPRFAAATDIFARLNQHALYGSSRDLVFLSERQNAQPTSMLGNEFADLDIGGAPSVVARFDAPDVQFAGDGLRVHAEIGSKLVDRLSGLVSSDRVVSVERSGFRGHVYNLSTGEGWYSAAGLIVSNCHCQAAPAWGGSIEGLRSREDTIATRTNLSDEQRARQNKQARGWIESNKATLGLI